jgi:AraC-like DNA-binding protein
LKKNIIYIILLILFSVALHAESPSNNLLFGEDQILPVDSIIALYSVVKENLPQNIPKAHEMAKLMNEQSLMVRVDSLIAKSYLALGLVYQFKDLYRISSRYYEEALKTELSESNVLFRLKIENNLGVNYDLLYDYENALKFYLKALKSAKYTNDSNEIYEVYINIGLVYDNMSNKGKAYYYTKTALDYFEKTNDKRNAALCLQNLGRIGSPNEKYEKRLGYFLKAIDIYRNIDDIMMVSENYYNVAFFYNHIKEFEKSNKYIDTALSLLKDFDLAHLEATYLLTKGKNLKELEQFRKSEALMTKSYEIFYEYNSSLKLKETILNLILLYNNWKKPKLQEVYINRLDSLSYEISKQELEKVIEENMILNEIDVNLEAIKHHKTIIAQTKESLQVRTVFIFILAIGIIVVLMIYRNLRKSYKDLFDKNVDENLTKPDICPNINDNDKDNELYLSILELLKDKKAYTDPNLSLSSLSDNLNTNDRYISQAINKYSNTNFSGLVNKFRVEEAKKCLLNKGLQHYSLEKIAELSGFNNRFTFTRVFKTYTKMSPSAFRKISESI